MKKLAFLIPLLILAFSLTVFAASENNLEAKDITKDLILENSASYDESTNTILLCPAQDWSNGKAKYPFEVSKDFTVTFDYKIGGGTGADGMVLAFFAAKDSVTIDGGFMNFEGCGGYGLEFDTYPNTNDSYNPHVAVIYDKVSNHLHMVDEPRIRDNQWHTAEVTVKDNRLLLSIDGEKIVDRGFNFNKQYRYMYFAATTGACTDNHYIRNVKFTGRAAYSNASQWAIPEMDKAETYGLIPNILKGADMTQLITRQEFANLAVGLYKSLTGTDPEVVKNPFTDIDDPQVCQAYGLGITNGTAPDKFSPKKDISREEVATMLTRTLKAYIPGLDTSTTTVEKFADDADISPWAKESVYFMVSKNVLYGIGDNKFAPKNTNSHEIAMKYANSTREQALIMAVRAYEAMK